MLSELMNAAAIIGLISVGLLYGSDAHAQYQRPTDQQIEYGPDGNRRTTITTDSQGSRTFYDAQTGKIVGRTSTDSQGTTTIYDGSGHRVGTVTNPRRK